MLGDKESKHRVTLFFAGTAIVADRGGRFIYSILIHVTVGSFFIWRRGGIFTVIT